MFTTIFAAVDGSEVSDQVLELARPLLASEGTSVTLFEVVPRLYDGVQARKAHQVAEDRLKAIASRLTSDGVTVGACTVGRGDAAEEILAQVSESAPDLVLMGTHGRGGLERLMRGSVAERVLRSCPKPLLLLNPKRQSEGPRFHRILVPLDGSELAAEILPLVEALGRTYDSRVTLLRVAPFLMTAVPSPVVQDPWDPEKVAATLAPARARLEAAGLPVEVKTAYGIESAEILAAAEDADLVAMSTHGRSGLSRWWFGSVAESVLRHCPAPLLLRRGEG